MGLVEIIRFEESLKMVLLVGFEGRVHFDSDFTGKYDRFGHFDPFSSFYGLDTLGGLWRAFGTLLAHFRVWEGHYRVFGRFGGRFGPFGDPLGCDLRVRFKGPF